MKFYFDEHIDPAIAQGLKSRGIDVKTTAEAGKLSASDSEQIETAYTENRVIVTADRDFLILASENYKHKGIIFITNIRTPVGELIRKIESTFFIEDIEMENRVRFI